MSEPTKEEAKIFGKLSSREKAAIILKALGREVFASIMRNLPDHEIEQLSVEIAFLKPIDSETEMHVLSEFYSMLQASEHISEGDFDLAKEDISGNLLTSDCVKASTSIHSNVGSGTKKLISDSLEKENTELTSSIKNFLFEFEDMLFFDDNSIQLILNKVDTKELSIALKAASDELRNKIFVNLAAMIQEETKYTFPVRLSVIEEAQKRTLAIVHRLLDYAAPLRLNIIEKAQQHIVEVFSRLVEEKQIVNVPAFRNFKAFA